METIILENKSLRCDKMGKCVCMCCDIGQAVRYSLFINYLFCIAIKRWMCLNHKCYRKDAHGTILLWLYFFSPTLSVSQKTIYDDCVIKSTFKYALWRELRAAEAMIQHKRKQTFRLRYVYENFQIYICVIS